MSKKSISWHVLFVVVFVALSCVYAYKGSQWIWFLDDILHTLGGVLLCSFSLWDHRKESLSWRTRGVVCLGFVALMSILWEEFWYYFREIISRNSEQYITLHDTMTDFLYALGGGFFRWACYEMANWGEE